MWSFIASSAEAPTSDSTISVFDHGFTVGDGVFETIQTLNGKFLSLPRHLERLKESASSINLVLPELDVIHSALDELRKEKIFQTARGGRLRVTCTSGGGPLGMHRGAGWTLVTNWFPFELPTVSLSLMTSAVPKFKESMFNQVKSISYLENLVALNQAVDAGFDEAVLLNELGFLAEGTGTNIFIIKGDEVKTPPLSEGALGGITRQVLLESAPWIQQSRISREEMLEADFMFVTSTTRNLQAVSRLDNVSFQTSNKLFQSLTEIYSAAIAKEWS
jgi:branched-chain amino acid aminotransferase